VRAVAGQRIEVRCFEEGMTQETERVVPMIVGQDEDEVAVF